MRLLIGQQSAAVMGLFDKVKYKQVTSMEDFQQEVRRVLGEFEAVVKGDYMLGKDVSLADLLIYPWFERWIIM
jgi:glutathione S-transferase